MVRPVARGEPGFGPVPGPKIISEVSEDERGERPKPERDRPGQAIQPAEYGGESSDYRRFSGTDGLLAVQHRTPGPHRRGAGRRIERSVGEE